MTKYSVLPVLLSVMFLMAGCEPPQPPPRRKPLPKPVKKPDPVTATNAVRAETAVQPPVQTQQTVAAAAVAKPEKPAQPQPPKKRPPKPILHDFEDADFWRPVNWDDPAQVTSVDKPRTQGAKAVRIMSTMPNSGKIVIEVPGELKPMDAYEWIQLDIYLDAKKKNYPAVITLACNGKNDAGEYVWIESPPRILQQGWNTNVNWNLRGPEWKSESTSWRFSIKPMDKYPAAKLHLLLHGLDVSEAMVLDNLRISVAAKDAPTLDDLIPQHWVSPRHIPPRHKAPPDQARADTLRAYVLNMLAQYVADLRTMKRNEKADLIDEFIDDGLMRKLVVYPMPAQGDPAMPKTDKKDDPAKKKDADDKRAMKKR